MPHCIDKTAVFLPYYPAEYRAEDGNAGKSPENPFFDRYKTNRSKFNHTAAARDISEGREKSYVSMLRVQSCARCRKRLIGMKEWEGNEGADRKDRRSYLFEDKIGTVVVGEMTRGEFRIRRVGQEINLLETTVSQGLSLETRKFFLQFESWNRLRIVKDNILTLYRYIYSFPFLFVRKHVYVSSIILFWFVACSS